MVEREAQPQEEATLEHAGRDRGVADRTEQDGVVGADPVQVPVGEDLAGAVVPGRAEVEVRGLEPDVRREGDAEDLQSFGHDLGADPVARDECESDA